MKTLLATTTALLVAAAAPAIAGDKYDKDMDGKAATMTMEEKMQKKQAMEMKQTNTTAAKYASGSDAFAVIDTNANGEVDFTEFSMFMEKKGYDASDSAKEYVKLTGTDNVITDRSFAGMDIANLPHKHLDDGAKHNMSTTQSASIMTSNQQTAVMGSTMTGSSMNASYGSFGDYDMNSDGRVDFNEYRKARSKNGVTTTAAAQEFIRFSDGGRDFDQIRFEQAASEDVLNRGYFRSQPRM